MNSNQIAVVNPESYSITGYIDIPDLYGAGDAAMMVQDGNYVYVNCWSYQNKIIRIDTTTDKVDASLEVGVQPKEMVMDRNKNLWVVTDGGGWEQNPAGFETPAIVKVNTSSFTIDKFELTMYANVGSIAINGEGDRIYYTCNDIYSMSISDNALPAEPIIEADPKTHTATMDLALTPTTGLVYVADAKDFTQNGEVRVYDNNGNLKKKFDTGICPRFFCWYYKK